MGRKKDLEKIKKLTDEVRQLRVGKLKITSKVSKNGISQLTERTQPPKEEGK